MIDPELKEHLEKIERDESELVNISKKNTGMQYVLGRGMLYGAGYIIGAILIIVIVGWILNIVGVIPAFSRQVSEFRTALQNVGGTVK